MTKAYCEMFGINQKQSNPQYNKWDNLLEGLKRVNQNLHFVSNVEESDVILIVEAKKSFKYYANLKRDYPKRKMILVIVEMPSVNPGQHTKKMQAVFDEIFIPNMSLTPNIYRGQGYDFPINILPLSPIVETKPMEKLSFGFVGTCKNNLTKSSLYSIRPKVLNLVSRYADLQLAGKDWSSNRLALIHNDLISCFTLLQLGLIPYLNKFMTSKVNLKRCNYLGEIDSKSELLLNCDIVLCIENDRYEFSEKFFDALSFGKVPFYIGPNLEKLGIPNAIYFYGGTNFKSARQALKLVNRSSINERLIALEKLREIVMSRWEQDIAFEKLCYKINLVLA